MLDSTTTTGGAGAAGVLTPRPNAAPHLPTPSVRGGAMAVARDLLLTVGLVLCLPLVLVAAVAPVALAVRAVEWVWRLF